MKRIWWIIAAVNAFLSLQPRLLAQSQTPGPILMSEQMIQERRERWNWIREPWTASEKPFALAKSQMRALQARRPFSRKDFHKTIFVELQQQAERDASAVSMFKWAFATYAWASQWGRGEYFIDQVQRAFRKRPSPRSYEYARMRFLTEVYTHWTDAEAETIANRLLKRKPRDLAVQWWALKNARLVSYGSKAKKDYTIQRAESLIKQYPTNASVVALAAEIYEGRYWGPPNTYGGNPNDLRKAMALFRRAQKLAATPKVPNPYADRIAYLEEVLQRAQKR